jgi:fluoroacetyl-CoA thioesterase
MGATGDPRTEGGGRVTHADIRVGAAAEASLEVTPDLVASHLGSGGLRVFATPAMALMVERTCRTLIEPHLPAGQSTVGVEIRVRHLAPTPLGKTVRIRAEITGLEGRAVDFRAELWDEAEKVGEADHRRMIIDVERFLKRVAAKM